MCASLDLDFGAAKGNAPVAHLFYNGGGMTAVTRFLAGAVSALLLAGAGIFWWQSQAQVKETAIPAPPPPPPLEESIPVAVPGQVGAPPPMPPGAPQQTREERRFARYDRNRDDIITRTEMLSSRTKAFRKLDMDGNNMLSLEEWEVKTDRKSVGWGKSVTGQIE